MPTISGTVYDDTGTPAANRTVRAYRRDTGAFLAEVATSAGSAVPDDPDYANVSLLLHMDGANGSTVFTDSSPSPKTVTRFGDAQISTAQSKFGGSSALFDGSGDYLSIPHSVGFNFGADNFTVELWFRPTTLTANPILFLHRAVATAKGILWAVNPDGSILALASDSSNTAWEINITSATGVVVADVWCHLALVRNGSSWVIYKDGVSVVSTTASFTVDDAGGDILIGKADNASANWLHGYVDEYRVTKGVARYTADFAPPTRSGFSVSPLPLGQYEITTPHTGECNVLCLDDTAGTVYEDLCRRATPA